MPTCPADFEPAARDLLSAALWAHIAGGSGEGQALRRNRAAFARWCIRPRVLQTLDAATTRHTLLGRDSAHPILLAPVSYQRLVHAEGEIATAQAADALDTTLVVSGLASQPLESIAAAHSGGKWFQLYFQGRKAAAELLARVENAGYQAIVLTVDAPVAGMRYAAERAGFSMPADVAAVNVAADAPLPEIGPGDSRVFEAARTSAPTWADVEWLRARTRLPLLLKGVAAPEDALAARDVGVEGLIVSNHGGRALPQAPASLDLLPPIRDAVGPDYTVLVDGGIRSGGDAFIALALGADAVLIGRLQLYALAVGGAMGVARLLRQLRDEFEVTMVLAGCATLDDINAGCVLPCAGNTS